MRKNKAKVFLEIADKVFLGVVTCRWRWRITSYLFHYLTVFLAVIYIEPNHICSYPQKEYSYDSTSQCFKRNQRAGIRIRTRQVEELQTFTPRKVVLVQPKSRQAGKGERIQILA